MSVVEAKTGDAVIVLEIERMLPAGLGLAHADGRTVFVPLSAPGDLLRVSVNRVRGKVAFASIVEIIKPSQSRIEPPCPYFGRCGGCDFQQLSYDAQLSAKQEIIRDCLRRIAGIQRVPLIEIYPSPKQWQYRGRARWQFDVRTGELGYFEAGSHRVCDVQYCAVLVPELQEALEQLRANGAGECSDRTFTEIAAVAGDQGVSLGIGSKDQTVREVSRTIAGETYHISANNFFQINHALLETFITNVVGDVHGRTAVELYSGVGLFTVPLARNFATVIAVEANAAATRLAQLNIQCAALSNVAVINASVSDWLNRRSRSLGSIDFLLLDPPRQGIDQESIANILSLAPKRICYVSCDPATLARDLKQFLANRFALDSVVGFDMFPQTHHVETVAFLTAIPRDR